MVPSSETENTARARALAAAQISLADAVHYEVHHLVEQHRLVAEPARRNLAAAGVGLHALANLLPLPKPHQAIHTRSYTAAIILVTSTARPYGYSTMVATLEQVKHLLRTTGRFP